MKNQTSRLLQGIFLSTILLMSSCRSAYEVTKVEGTMVPIDSTWDAKPNQEAVALLAPYKAKIDSMMYRVLGTAQMSMDKGQPEGLLSNLIADVLREAAAQTLGKPADMGLVNIGGIRSVLTEGPITCGIIYEILPFENSLCVLTIKGSYLKLLFENIAAQHGEGVSGVKLKITKDGKLLDATVGGQVVKDDQLYTVATVDYLADGNDGMVALPQAEKRVCPDGATLRGLFMDYVEQQTAAGKKITARMEGRITLDGEK
ncbi:MAG: 5'-nucleotidase C-terminal domain-containing protein [Bacteroides sp.]|jgi:2',3'-cyclic-nucleotide 2'-phosphodiesterase (5'-nucleotidase family)|nr:5'-nucleotidase C-terminal domain-containing protein [Bacteroides sp.]